jgi:hypothetical protein
MQATFQKDWFTGQISEEVGKVKSLTNWSMSRMVHDRSVKNRCRSNSLGLVPVKFLRISAGHIPEEVVQVRSFQTGYMSDARRFGAGQIPEEWVPVKFLRISAGHISEELVQVRFLKMLGSSDPSMNGSMSNSRRIGAGHIPEELVPFKFFRIL